MSDKIRDVLENIYAAEPAQDVEEALSELSSLRAELDAAELLNEELHNETVRLENRIEDLLAAARGQVAWYEANEDRLDDVQRYHYRELVAAIARAKGER